MLYMYHGGGAVDNAMPFLLGGLVVLCKNWRWAAFAHAAARVAGLTSHNHLEHFSEELVIPFEDEGNDAAAMKSSATTDFTQKCEVVWDNMTKTLDDEGA